MQITTSERGFQFLEHPAYLEPHEDKRLASQSSAVGDYDDSLDRAGSSFLWISDNHHLNREEVAEFAKHLLAWVETGSLKLNS